MKSKSMNPFKYFFPFCVGVVLASCSNNSSEKFSQLEKFLNSRGVPVEKLRDTTLSERDDAFNSARASYSNLKEVLTTMRQYGYFLGNEKNQDFILSPAAIQKICEYGIFEPYAFTVNMNRKSGTLSLDNSSYYCNNKLEGIIDDFNKAGGCSEVDTLSKTFHQPIDSTLLIGQPYAMWLAWKYRNGELMVPPINLVAFDKGFIWVNKPERVTRTNDLELNATGYSTGGAGYAINIFDKNGYFIWAAEAVNALGINDNYELMGYKVKGDSLQILAGHKFMNTYGPSHNRNKDLCFEIYITSYDIHNGRVLNRQTLSKHFNSEYANDYKEAVPQLERMGVKDVSAYMQGDDELTDEERKLSDEFQSMKAEKKEVKIGTDVFTAQDIEVPGKFSLSKNDKELQLNGRDKYFERLFSFSYSPQLNKFIGAAEGKSYFGDSFYYIRTISLDGVCSPIILKSQ